MLIYKDGIVADYRKVFPNVSFPSSGPSDDFLSSQGAKKVNLWKPHDPQTQKLVSVTPYEEDQWVYTVEVQEKTQEELEAALASKAAQVRSERNLRLSDTDWTQLADAPVDQLSWALYRQALRDLTQQPGFPSDVSWPLKPGEQPIEPEATEVTE